MPAPRTRTKSRIKKRDWEWLLRTQKVCQVCGTDQDLTGDHILSIGRGGLNVRGNLQLLCRRDNSAKGRTIDRLDMVDGKQIKPDDRQPQDAA